MTTSRIRVAYSNKIIVDDISYAHLEFIYNNAKFVWFENINAQIKMLVTERFILYLNELFILINGITFLGYAPIYESRVGQG